MMKIALAFASLLACASFATKLEAVGFIQETLYLDTWDRETAEDWLNWYLSL